MRALCIDKKFQPSAADVLSIFELEKTTYFVVIIRLVIYHIISFFLNLIIVITFANYILKVILPVSREKRLDLAQTFYAYQRHQRMMRI